MLACAAACSTAVSSLPARAAAPDLAAIDAYVNGERAAQHMPGLALGLVHGDLIVHVAGFGAADESGRPVTGDTPFFLGSTTKSFTALAIMQLIEAHRLALDARVRDVIPWFRVADEAASAAITVRDLVYQTSGLSTRAGRLTLTEYSTGADALENRVRRLASIAPTAPVGSRFQYSNANYQVLGLIVQQIAGEPYEGYVEQHIFAPLAMTHSFTAKAPAAAAGLALGHRMIFGRPTGFDEPFPRGSVSQGFLISSASDLTHYLIAQLNDGRYGDASVLSADGIAQLHRGVAAGDGNGGARYAMGWVDDRHFDRRAVWHDGDTFGYHSFIALLPDDGWGVVVLANANDIAASLRFEAIAWGVLGRAIGRVEPPAHVHDAAIAHGILVGILLLQLLGVARTAAVLRRWRRSPDSRPALSMRIARIGLPFAVGVVWALLVLVGIPRSFGPLDVATMAVPDLAWLLIASAVFAGVWAFVRVGLAARALRASAAL